MDTVGVSEGDLVRVTIVKIAMGRGIDLSTLPVFADPDPKASANHDRYLYGPRS
jgi:hypothetical protein